MHYNVARLGSAGGMPSPAAAWYVAQTLPHKEQWAIQHLRFQGFETFFPRFRCRELRRSVPRVTLKPVFPGYVFVAFDAEGLSWPSIRGTRGVRRLVGPALGRPQSVPKLVMELLFARCSGEIMTALLEEIRPGDKVQINSGPLFRRIAEVESLSPGGRVSLLFDMLGCTNSIEVDRSSLSPVI